MNMEKPFGERRRNLDNLVYEGPERRKSRFVSSVLLEPGQTVEDKGVIANVFPNPDGSYRIVFENGAVIEQLDRDDGLNVLNKPEPGS